jgi:FeS assembly SUF system protein
MDITLTQEQLEGAVIDILRTCYDPEIPVNIYDLGLIYGVNIDEKSAVNIVMTLTSPSCPVAGILPPQVEEKVKGITGVTAAKVHVVWEPRWTQDMMSEAARLELGLF